MAALGLAPPPEASTTVPGLDGEDALALIDSILETGGAIPGVKGAPASAGPSALLDVARLAQQAGAKVGGADPNAAANSLVGELVRAAVAKSESGDADEASAAPAPGTSPASNALDAFHALLAGRAGAPAAAQTPSAAGLDAARAAPPPDVAKSPSPADLMPRVALSDVPTALPALLDRLGPDVRFGKRGKNWEVELRLDPPELGSLRFRLELHGDEIRGVVQCEPRVERLLGPVLKDLEENLRQHGGGATFDLQREAKGEERPSAPRATSSGAIPRAAAEPRAPSRIASDPSRLVDVTA